MFIGSLNIEVRRDGKMPKLLVEGRLHGLETDITREQLEQLASHLAREAARWRDETKD